MNLTISNLSLFETTKENRQNFVSQLIDGLNNGYADPLKIHLQVKCMEDLIKRITSSDEYKEYCLTEAAKYGRSFEYHNSKFEVKEMGIKYDYTKCNDPVLWDIEVRMIELENKLKERQKFLKSVPLSGVQILSNDELVTIYPPTKISTTSVSVTLK
jgi:hypothetical protein